MWKLSTVWGNGPTQASYRISLNKKTFSRWSVGFTRRISVKGYPFRLLCRVARPRLRGLDRADRLKRVHRVNLTVPITDDHVLLQLDPSAKQRKILAAHFSGDGADGGPDRYADQIGRSRLRASRTFDSDIVPRIDDNHDRRGRPIPGEQRRCVIVYQDLQVQVSLCRAISVVDYLGAMRPVRRHPD